MAIMSAISGKLRPSINFSIFLNFSSDSSSIKSPRNFDGQVVGLGVVAAMNETKDAAHEAAKMLVLAKSLPIPIVSSKTITSLREESSSSESVELAELSESYTCVISHLGKGNSISVMKREHQSAINVDCKGKSGVFFASPMKNNIESPPQMYQTADFLSSCYLCRKNLHGLDIFMYR